MRVTTLTQTWLLLSTLMGEGGGGGGGRGQGTLTRTAPGGTPWRPSSVRPCAGDIAETWWDTRWHYTSLTDGRPPPHSFTRHPTLPTLPTGREGGREVRWTVVDTVSDQSHGVEQQWGVIDDEKLEVGHWQGPTVKNSFVCDHFCFWDFGVSFWGIKSQSLVQNKINYNVILSCHLCSPWVSPHIHDHFHTDETDHVSRVNMQAWLSVSHSISKRFSCHDKASQRGQTAGHKDTDLRLWTKWHRHKAS